MLYRMRGLWMKKELKKYISNLGQKTLQLCVYKESEAIKVRPKPD
jgi:hypothetical protein